MTTVTSATCSDITVESTYLTALNQAVTLTVVYNCKTTYIADVNVSDTSIVITPTTVNSTLDYLQDGIYSIKVEIVQEDGDVVIESACVFVNCQTACMMIEIFKSTTAESIAKSIAYQALLASVGCTSCSCDDLCILYNTLSDNCFDYAQPCGCK